MRFVHFIGTNWRQAAACLHNFFFQKWFGVAQTRLNKIAKNLKEGDAFQDKNGGDTKKDLFREKKKLKSLFQTLRRGNPTTVETKADDCTYQRS